MQADQIEMIEFAAELDHELDKWEQNFIYSLADRDDDYVLSDLQDKKLREIKEKLQRSWIR